MLTDEIRQRINPTAKRQSFSNNVSKQAVSHEAKKIILFVEGETDVKFYKSLKILNEKKINIQEIERKKQYLIRNCNYVKGKRAVLALINDRIEKIQNNNSLSPYYGIVDKDYDGLLIKEFPKVTRKYVIMTDANDLETTLLMLDMQNIKQQLYRDNISSFLLNLSIEYAAYIGKLRKLRQDRNDNIPNNNGFLEKGVKIHFTDKEEISIGITPLYSYRLNLNGYYKFLDNEMIFDTDLFFENKTSNSIRKINKTIAKYNGNSLSYCRGHDIFDFFAVLTYRFGLVKKDLFDNIYKRKLSNELSIIELRSEYEEIIKSYFNPVSFKQSNMYHFFIMLNKK